jgi:hypothetical protein
MRRGSLIGPLLIILIGVWFLLSALRPDLPLLDIAATYWPFLLIAWGVLRLLEILVWAARSKPVPSSGVGGGEWTLVVFICLAGSLLFAVNHYRPWSRLGVIASRRVDVFGHAYDYPIAQQTRPAGKTPRIVVENLRGNVRLVGADVQEVKVSGRKTVRALEQSDADTADKQCPLEISTQGEQIVVRTNQDRVTGERRASADLDITVPRGASLEGRGREGDFEVSDLGGGVEISSDNAGVRLQNVDGNVRLDLRRSDLVRVINAKGSVEVLGGRGRDIELENIGGPATVTGSYSGDLKFRNIAKPLRFQSSQTDLRVERLPGQLRTDLSELSGSKLIGPIRLTTNSRDVQLEDFTESLEISLDRGDISLRPAQLPLARIDARTRRGQVEVALPAKAQFHLKATTSQGEAQNDFGPDLRYESEGRRGASLQGGTGQGPSITLATDRGSITVRKDTGTPLAAHQEKDRSEVEVSMPDRGALKVQRQ